MRRLRADNDRLTELAASRAVRLAGANQYVETLTRQKRRLQDNHDSLLRVVAAHITTGASPEQLRTAVVRAGFRAELEYALLEIPENTRRQATAGEEVTPA